MFIAPLFIIVPSWKQPKYPLTGKWIYKLSYIHVTNYHSAITRKNYRNNAMTFTGQKKPDIRDMGFKSWMLY